MCSSTRLSRSFVMSVATNKIHEEFEHFDVAQARFAQRIRANGYHSGNIGICSYWEDFLAIPVAGVLAMLASAKPRHVLVINFAASLGGGNPESRPWQFRLSGRDVIRVCRWLSSRGSFFQLGISYC